jgi:beta-lactamase class A
MWIKSKSSARVIAGLSVFFIAAFLLTPVQAFSLQKKSSFDSVYAAVLQREVSSFPHQTSIWIEALDPGKEGFTFVHEPDKPFKAASVIKLPIMAVCFQLANENKLDLEAMYTLQDADKTGGSGDMQHIQAGKKFRYIRLIELMITKSDNTAANVLIDTIGMEELNRRFRSLGLTQTRLECKILEEISERAVKQGLMNYTSARDNAILLKSIHEKSCVSDKASERMLEFLLRQKVRNRIPRWLTPDARVANKTGTLNGVFHDVGVVTTAQGAFIVCVLTQGKFTYKTAKDFISHISRLAFDYYLGFALKS